MKNSAKQVQANLWQGLRNGMVRNANVLVLMACVIFAPGAGAQTTSTIAGTVKDKQGAAIAGAKVHVTSTALAIDRTATTDAEGEYRVTALQPGNYAIKAEKDGFQTAVFKELELTLNRELTFDVTLEVGSVNQSVEVSSAVPLVDTTVSSTGSTITPQQIEDMPINGRNYLDLLQLVPGGGAESAKRSGERQRDADSGGAGREYAVPDRWIAKPRQLQRWTVGTVQPGFDSGVSGSNRRV